MEESTKMEFAVQMTGEKCVKELQECLSGIGQIDMDINMGRLIVNTTAPWSEVRDKIESTGRRAVLSGFGGQSAVAIINSVDNQIRGVVRFSSIDKSKGCIVDGVIDGLTPGPHAIHICENGDLSRGCDSLGNHYNPYNAPHGSPSDPVDRRHAGDLGNINAAENGRATFRFIDNIVNVGEIIGRSIAVTENADDFGKTGIKLCAIDGNSGRRLACGIIARSAGIYQNYKRICACDGVTIWDERDKPIAGGDRNQTGKL